MATTVYEREIGGGDGNENVISKYSFSFLYLFRDNSNLFDLQSDGELSRDYITINGVKARKEKENFAVTRSRSRGNIKGSLSNDDGDGDENVISKSNFSFL